jgi:endonuclease IV
MFGPHVSKNHLSDTKALLCDHIKAAINEANKNNFSIKAISIFVSNPHGKYITTSTIDLDEIRKYSKNNNIEVVVHNSYATPLWTSADKLSESIGFITKQLDICWRSEFVGLVVHIPNTTNENIANSIISIYNKLLSNRTLNNNTIPILFLETPALASDDRFGSPVSLSKLFEFLKTKLGSIYNYIGMCVDTAHLWTNGIDVSTIENANKWLLSFDNLFKSLPKKNIIFHINDSANPRGRGPDKHAALTAGYIWKDFNTNINSSGLAVFIDYIRKNNLMGILERKQKELFVKDYKIINAIK